MINVKMMETDNELLEKYEALKAENKKLKNKISSVQSEVSLQIKECNSNCKYINDNDINKAYPKGEGLQTIFEAYNRSADTERLIFKQKLQTIKNILD